MTFATRAAEGLRDTAEIAATAEASAVLPEWNLGDLYPAMDSPRLKADLAKAENESVSFEQRFKGKLEALATGAEPGRDLAAAVVAFEKLEDLLGRLVSYAGLLHAGDELAVGQAKLAHAGIDALDPKRSEVALADAAVAIGVFPILLDARARGADRIAGAAD